MKTKTDSLLILWGIYIRKRAISRHYHGCERCGTWKDDYRQLQPAHYIGKRKLATRYDIDNGAGLCGGCHLYLDHVAPQEKVEFFKKLLGQEAFDNLIMRANWRHPAIDRNAITLDLRQRIKELDQCLDSGN